MKKGYIKVFSLDEYKYIWVDKNEAFQYYIDNILDFETVDEYLNMYDISNKYRVELVLKAFNDIMMNKLELSVIKQSKRGLLISDCYNDAEFQTWNTIIYNIRELLKIELNDFYVNICNDVYEKYGNGFFHYFHISYDENTKKYHIHTQKRENDEIKHDVMSYEELKERLL